jgi:hypothetical protein
MALAGCGMSTKELAKQVQADIEKNWSGDAGLTIKDFTLIKKSKTEYRGILTVTDGEDTENLTVNVTMDGDSFMWEIES